MKSLSGCIVVLALAAMSACSAGAASSSGSNDSTPPSNTGATTSDGRTIDDPPPTDRVTTTEPEIPESDPSTTSAGENRPPVTEGRNRVDESVEDPSFELGPDIVLDVDVARFPVDDAGVGGVPTTEPRGSDETDDGDVSPPSSGWAGFDASLAGALIGPGNTAASVAVLIDGDVVHRSAFGRRDPSSGDRADVEDRFRIASISKTITAIVALELVEDGVVALDDPVGQLVADHIGAGAIGGSANLTLRQLLTHRSGFGTYDTQFFRGGATDCPDAARQGLASGVAGGGYTYSNMNFCVAGLVIEALTGLTYEQAVYENLLTPLGISGMRLAPTFDPGPGETQHVSGPGRNYMETLGAAGAWIASPTDLVTIMDSLDSSTPGFKPLDDVTALQMITPFGGQPGQRGYGYGMISYGFGRFGHTGTIESTHAMLLNRGDGVTWAVTVAGQTPDESTDLERIVNAAFAAGGFVAG